ncbi:unnamed protein product [Ilex paraguariensis]|uniref:TORTIFOLIA1/TORL1-2 C-terminal domain-containing protein n=1 Tax=Ilex paraguariensis TaxID=185542 RepID=A0ABC8T961_9AQUA
MEYPHITGNNRPTNARQIHNSKSSFYSLGLTLIRENFCGADSGDVTSASESTSKAATFSKVGTDSIKRRSPLSVRKDGHNYVENPQHSRAKGWHIEIAVPKSHDISLADREESEDSSMSIAAKTLEKMTSTEAVGFEYVPMDGKQEYSSVSNVVTDKFETKLEAVSPSCLGCSGSVKRVGTIQLFPAEEISTEEQRYLAKLPDRRSLDSTITESSSRTMHGCCLQTTDEIVSIRKQLLGIENKQSNLLDLLKVFTTNTMDCLSMIQLKVSSLEHVVDRLAQEVVNVGSYSDLATAKLLKKSPNVASPRLSTYTPRPPVDVRNRKPLLMQMKNAEIWEEKAFSRSRSSSSSTGVDMWTDPTVRLSRNPIGQNCSGQGTNSSQTRKADVVLGSAFTTSERKINSESKNNLWKLVKGYISEGDLDSAYVEALCLGDDIVLIELLDRTGPVLENLSHQTASDVLSTLASYLLEQRFMNSIIPWLQQVVDLSTIHGPNYLVLSGKARREFLVAIQEAVKMEYSNPAERSRVTQLAMKLHRIWGEAFFEC